MVAEAAQKSDFSNAGTIGTTARALRARLNDMKPQFDSALAYWMSSFMSYRAGSTQLGLPAAEGWPALNDRQRIQCE